MSLTLHNNIYLSVLQAVTSEVYKRDQEIRERLRNNGTDYVVDQVNLSMLHSAYKDLEHWRMRVIKEFLSQWLQSLDDESRAIQEKLFYGEYYDEVARVKALRKQADAEILDPIEVGRDSTFERVGIKQDSSTQ